jgi:hypothetical protein
VVRVAWYTTMSNSVAPSGANPPPPNPFWTNEDRLKVHYAYLDTLGLLQQADKISEMTHVSPPMASAISDILERASSKLLEVALQLSSKVARQYPGASAMFGDPAEIDDIVDNLDAIIHQAKGGAE